MTTTTDWREWLLEPEQEFRFEVGQKQTATIKLVEGNAELFGTELAIDVEYTFTARKLAIFTWKGCTLLSSGKDIVEYTGMETPMNQIINVQFALENIRKEAKLNDQIGPRVMIVGPSDVGKTSLVRILASYSARLASHPILCDIDPNGGLISLPGTISAMAIHRPIDPEEEFNASVSVYRTTPISYYYGTSVIFEKQKLYTSLISQLAETVELKLQDKSIKSNGLIIDTPSQFLEQGGFDILAEAIEKFKVTIILVIGHERLLSDLHRKYPDKSTMTILKLNKSGGVASRDKTYRRQSQLQRVKEYFYGTIKNDLTPFSQTVSFSEVVVRRVVEGTLAPSSALPIGMEANPHEIKFVKVDAGDILLHSVLAVSYAPLPGSGDAVDAAGKPKVYTPEEETSILLKSNLCGFVYVSEVDETKRKMTILSPNPGRLPKTYLIMGALKWMDA
ncbi:hypothetical protein HDV02_000445 [Globomyces sp. JEL0801]|nr:hypothetical protein HDV02_000445 [Globomyces sp. JEL0801]